MIYSIPLHDLVTIKTQANHVQAVRAALRLHFSSKMGLKPNQTDEQYLFFRQNLQSTTCAQAYTEWCEIGRQPDRQLSVHMVVKCHPSLLVKETDWFRLIRYCLKNVSGPSATSVVFFRPRKNQTLDLFIQQATPGMATDLSADVQSLIYQMMALQIALYFEKPLYTNAVTIPGLRATLWQQELYINSVVYQALANERVTTPDEFQGLLLNRYQVQTRAQVKHNRYVKLQMRYPLGEWLSPTASGLPLKDINQWLIFNRMLAHSSVAGGILNGPCRSSAEQQRPQTGGLIH